MVVLCVYFFLFFFKQKTAYEMRISDWSSDVCSSDLDRHRLAGLAVELQLWVEFAEILQLRQRRQFIQALEAEVVEEALGGAEQLRAAGDVAVADDADPLALLDRKSTRLNSSH